MDERGQADAVFSCCADEPELESPVAETQWLPLVLTVNSRIIEFIRELAVWMELSQGRGASAGRSIGRGGGRPCPG